MRPSAAAVNAALPRYPITVEDKNWTYGVWYCGTSWTKVVLHGQYPPTFLKRALALFPVAKDILHAPSGILRDMPDGHITIDMVSDAARHPMMRANCESLPFRDASFDLVLSDPPYTAEDSKIYGCPPFSTRKAMREFRRVLRPGGCLGMLHTYYPDYSRKEWDLCALIAVVTGFRRATRMFSIFERVESPRQIETFENTQR